MGIPCKTAAGHAELASPSCRLSKRHRALLLLVDGDRMLDEVVRLGRVVGVPRSYIDELFALGLIVIGPPMAQPICDFDSRPCPLGDSVDQGQPIHDFTQARRVVLQVLRAHAPVTGMVMMLRVRRARSRAELHTLLPEVQARLSRSRPPAEARQLMQRVESLLALC